MERSEYKLLHKIRCLCQRIETLESDTGGGGTTYTFENGITEAAGVVKLGGPLTEDTTITGGSTNFLDITGLQSSSISAVGSITLTSSSTLNLASLSINFTSLPSNNVTPTKFLTLQTVGTEVQYSTVSDMKTALGIGSGAGLSIFTQGSIPFAGVTGVLTEDNANLFYDDTNNRLGIATTTPASRFHVITNNLGVTQTTSSGITLENTTAASLGNSQKSPELIFKGNAWSTNGSVNKPITVIQDILPSTDVGSGLGTYTWRLRDDRVTTGTFADQLTMVSGGAMTLRGNTFTFSSGGVSSIQSNFGMYIYPGTSAGGAGYGLRIGTSTPAATARVNIDGQTLTTAVGYGCIDMAQTWNHASANPTAIKLNITNTLSAATALLMDLQVGSVSQFKVGKTGNISVTKTITAALTTGNQTINKTAGQVNFAATDTTLVVTNSFVDENSIVMCQVLGSDATFTSCRVTKAAGSFTITANAAATAETAVSFLVIN